MQTHDEPGPPTTGTAAAARRTGRAADREPRSILFDAPIGGLPAETGEAPACFRDLNLDQIVEAITSGRQEYRLDPFFHQPLTDPAAVAFRHEILRDLADRALCAGLEKFSAGMRTAREHLARTKNSATATSNNAGTSKRRTTTGPPSRRCTTLCGRPGWSRAACGRSGRGWADASPRSGSARSGQKRRG